MELKNILNALFTSLNSHVDRGFAAMLKILKDIEKKEDAGVAKAISVQTSTLRDVFGRFSKSLDEIKNPQIDVAVNTLELEKAVRGIGKFEKTDLKNVEVLLKMIFDAVASNKPEALAEKFDALDAVFKGLKPKDSVKFDDAQMKGLMAALTNRQIGTAGGTKSATAWQVNTVILTNANTEYEYTFPANTISWSLKLRGAMGILYYASATGKLPTSGSGTDYITVPASAARSQDNVEYGGKKMYFQSDLASQVVEIDVFTL